MSVIETRIFNLSSNSSSLCNNGSMKSDCEFNIPHLVSKTENIENIYFSIYSAEIPNSFYLINKYNNLLIINDVNYYLDYGNYNINTLITALTTLTSLTITYSSLTMKLTLTSSSSITISYNSTITRIMGLDNETNMTSTLIDTIYTLTLPYVVNLLPYQKIHFRSNGLQLNNYNAYDKSSDIFLSLQNNSSFGTGLYFQNNSGDKYLLEAEQLQTLDVRITDDNNRFIDFNNCDWYLTIKIEYHLKEKPERNYLYKLLGKNNDEFIKRLLLTEFQKN